MGLFNSTCPLPKAYIDLPNIEEPVFGSVRFQDLMVYIGGGCTAVTAIASLFLITRHLCWYTRPREQRQIIRIVCYPLISAILALFSIYSYPDSLYLGAAESLYEPVALVGIFFLFTEYVAPDRDSRELFFAELENRKKKGGRFSRKKGYDVIPGGSLRWYHSKWVALYFYFVASIIIHTVEEITQAFGRYCSSSFSPTFAHVWVMVISNISLPVGVAAVLQFYWRLKSEPNFPIHGAFMKLISFKLVVFIDFFQGILFDILIGTHSLKGSKSITYRDLSVGLPALLTTFEMMIVSIWFVWTYSAKEYRLAKTTSDHPLNMWQAILHALNPTDMLQGAVFAFRLLLRGVGPKGNGSWRRSGGYNKVKGPYDGNIKLMRSHDTSSDHGDLAARDEESMSEYIPLQAPGLTASTQYSPYAEA